MWENRFERMCIFQEMRVVDRANKNSTDRCSTESSDSIRSCCWLRDFFQLYQEGSVYFAMSMWYECTVFGMATLR
jgi:hypothetical protein